MDNKKLFVVLEQGNKCNTLLSKEHKKQFSTEYSDFFRVNWKADTNDKEAHFYKDNIVWSEGRSLLFEKVKDNYEYYIFIDDDVKFISKTDNSVAEELKYFFKEYNPLTGTIFGDNWAWDLYKNTINTNYKEVFPIMGHDLCCHFFQEDFAKHMFPAYFPGSECSMWYAQFIGYKLYPQKCMVFNKITVKNTENIKHKDSNNEQYINGNDIVKKFSKLIKDTNNMIEFLSWRETRNFVRNSNKLIYTNPINKEPITFDDTMLKNIINIPEKLGKFSRCVSPTPYYKHASNNII